MVDILQQELLECPVLESGVPCQERSGAVHSSWGGEEVVRKDREEKEVRVQHHVAVGRRVTEIGLIVVDILGQLEDANHALMNEA